MDVSKIEYENIRKIFAKGPKYREPQSINRKYNFKRLIDSVGDYARKWTKREKEAVETFSEWVKAIRSLAKSKMGNNIYTEMTNMFCI